MLQPTTVNHFTGKSIHSSADRISETDFVQIATETIVYSNGDVTNAEFAQPSLTKSFVSQTPSQQSSPTRRKRGDRKKVEQKTEIELYVKANTQNENKLQQQSKMIPPKPRHLRTYSREVYSDVIDYTNSGVEEFADPT